MKWIAWSIGGIVVALVAATLCLWLLTNLVLYYAPARQHLQPADFDSLAARVPGGVEKIRLKTSDGVGIVAWYLPARLAPGDMRLGVVLTHGGGDDKRFYLPLAERLRNEGFDMILPDLRGHGESERSPRGLTLGITEGRDVAAAADFLLYRAHVRQIAAGGVSMGGAATVMAAATQRRIGPLILESTTYDAHIVFETLLRELGLPAGRVRTGLAGILTTVGLWRMGAPWEDARQGVLPVLRLASTLPPRPVLFMLGDKDPLITRAGVYRYRDAFRAGGRVLIFPGVGHGVYPRRPAPYSTIVSEYLGNWRREVVAARLP